MPVHGTEGFSEVLETQTHPETIQEAFVQGRAAFYNLPFESDFETALDARGIAQDATDTANYWETVADHAAETASQAREQGTPERIVLLNELLASTPDFVYKNYKLNHRHDHVPADEYDYLKNSVSYYNGLLRATVAAWPDARASEMSRQLLNIANISIENRHVRHNTDEALRATIVGAQHEIGFGQLLAFSGRSVREATVSEDRRGIDYTITDATGRVDRIDVKASLRSITKLTHDTTVPYAVSPRDGRITMYSLLRSQDFKDRFYLPDDVVAQRGVEVDVLLARIHREQHTGNYAGHVYGL